MSSIIFSGSYILFCRLTRPGTPLLRCRIHSRYDRPNEPIFFLIHMLSFTLLQADSSRHAVAALRARRYRLAIKLSVLTVLRHSRRGRCSRKKLIAKCRPR